jgi:biotin carboxyl carrier protein
MFLNKLSESEQTVFVQFASLLTAVDKKIVDNVYKTTELTTNDILGNLLGKDRESSSIPIGIISFSATKILVKVGDTVTKETPVIRYISTLRLERYITASHAGVVTRLDIQEGDTLHNNAVIGMVREEGAVRGIQMFESETDLITQSVKSDDLLNRPLVDQLINTTYKDFETFLSTLHEDIDDDEEDASEAVLRVKYALKLCKRYTSISSEGIDLSSIDSSNKRTIALGLYLINIESFNDLNNQNNKQNEDNKNNLENNLELRNKLIQKIIKLLEIEEDVAQALKMCAVSIHAARDSAWTVIEGTNKQSICASDILA